MHIKTNDPSRTRSLFRLAEETTLPPSQAYAARIIAYAPIHVESNAFWTLENAVESAIIPVRGSPDLVASDSLGIEDLPYKVALASVWILHAGHVLYGRERRYMVLREDRCIDCRRERGT